MQWYNLAFGFMWVISLDFMIIYEHFFIYCSKCGTFWFSSLLLLQLHQNLINKTNFVSFNYFQLIFFFMLLIIIIISSFSSDSEYISRLLFCNSSPPVLRKYPYNVAPPPLYQLFNVPFCHLSPSSSSLSIALTLSPNNT